MGLWVCMGEEGGRGVGETGLVRIYNLFSIIFPIFYHEAAGLRKQVTLLAQLRPTPNPTPNPSSSLPYHPPGWFQRRLL